MTTHEHVEEISSGRHAYRIQMGGTMDGENTRSPVGYQVYDQAFEPDLFVRMENVGDTPVVDPWLIANGRDWRTLESIVAAEPAGPAAGPLRGLRQRRTGVHGQPDAVSGRGGQGPAGDISGQFAGGDRGDDPAGRGGRSGRSQCPRSWYLWNG